MPEAISQPNSDAEEKPPRAFISYGWGDQEHEQWVLDLSTELREFGVDVVLDKWELRENADKYEYMEQIVTDPEMRKVIMICDKNYAEKADKRESGVGTETQIISAEVYQTSLSENKNKFCAVIKETDESGKAYTPTYLKTRIYIDMSTADLRLQNFEQLVRWIFDKPIHEKPPLGKRPTFLEAQDLLNLQTSSRYRLASVAIKSGKANAMAFVRDYLSTLTGSFEQLRISPREDVPFDDQVVESIEAFRPYRNEFLEMVSVLCDFSETEPAIDEIHGFFERLLPFLFTRGRYNGEHVRDFQNDNYRFIVAELFLLTCAVMSRKRKWNWVADLSSREYFLGFALQSGRESKLHPFLRFRMPIPSLEERTRRLSPPEPIYPKLILEGLPAELISVEDVTQADFILYLKDNLTPEFSGRGSWYPSTVLLYRGRPFEAFSRSESRRFWEQFKIAVGASSKEALEEFIKKYEDGSVDKIYLNQIYSFDPRNFSNLDAIATKD